MKNSKQNFVLGALVALVSANTFATEGYFSHGVGIKAKGRGGAAVAMTDDAFGGANNPATMVWVGDRMDLGIDYFRPVRGAERTGSGGFGAGSIDFSTASDSNNFLIPEFGYNHMISPSLSMGLSAYGNGGLNTDYAGGQINCGAGPKTANALCGSGRLGVDMMQLIIAPTLSYKFNANHSIGVSPLLGYQRFKAEGLQAFDNAPGFPPFSGAPGYVTNNGYDNSTGAGVRIGYYGRLSNMVSVGATYASKMSMSKFDKYKGLFANDGGFDIPENYSAGIAVRPTDRLTFALDYLRVNYSGVPAINNPSSNMPPLGPLGSANGPGFGWQSIDAVKVGVEFDYSASLRLRAGYAHGNDPIKPVNVTFNILAPGVIQDHATLGLTQKVGKQSELSMSYLHAFKKSVTGPSLFNAFGAGVGGQETIHMYEDALGIAYAMSF